MRILFDETSHLVRIPVAMRRVSPDRRRFRERRELANPFNEGGLPQAQGSQSSTAHKRWPTLTPIL